MKHFLGIAMISFLLFIFYTCKKTDVDRSPTPEELGFQKVPVVLNNFTIAGLKIPDGTTTKYLSDSEIEFRFPDGWKLIELDLEKNVYNFYKEYSCTCTGTGCDVIAIGDDVGCSSCTKECTGKWKGSSSTMKPIINSDANDDEYFLGFVNFNLGIRKVEKEELSALPAFPEHLLNVPEINTLYETFIKEQLKTEKYNPANFTDNRYVLVPHPVNFLGFATFLNIPVKKEEGALMLRYMAKPKCNCDVGSSGCTLKEIETIIGTHVGWKCEKGSCTTCTMSGI